MTPSGVLYIVMYFLCLLALTKPLGLYMAHVFEGERTFLHPLLRPLERLIYRLCGIREDAEQRWTQYAASLLAFSLVSFLFVYAIQRLQGFLPFNPMGFSTGHAPADATPMTPDLAFNTAVSFMTNTNWQSYGGEPTLSYFVQMAALTVQNFVSAAAGIAVAIALIRGFARKQANTIGNFWVDLTRATVYVLLPLAFVFALFLCARGVPQTLKAYQKATTLGRSHANDRGRPGGRPGSHQDAGHQWRRLLQCQFLPSLRKPDPAHQFHRAAFDPGDFVGPHLYLRKDGR